MGLSVNVWSNAWLKTNLVVPVTNDVDADRTGDGSCEFVDPQLSVLRHPVAPLAVPVKKGVDRAEDETLLDAQVDSCGMSHDGVDEGDGGEGFAQTHAVRQDRSAHTIAMRVVLLH